MLQCFSLYWINKHCKNVNTYNTQHIIKITNIRICDAGNNNFALIKMKTFMGKHVDKQKKGEK